jgi:hypothetical protein
MFPLRSLAVIALIAVATLFYGCYPRLAYHHGKHSADFAAISRWMNERGFHPKSWQKGSLIGSGSTEHYPDYAWYRGTYISNCAGNILISISEKDELQVNAFQDGCPEYAKVDEVALPDMVRGIERFYREYKAR